MILYRLRVLGLAVGLLAASMIHMSSATASADAREADASVQSPRAILSINVSTKGIPAGAVTRIRFKGPSTKTVRVSKSANVRLRVPGRYSWTATPVKFGSTTYSPKPARGTVQVRAGKSTRLRINFAAASPVPPGPPTSVQLQPGNESITVAWRAPANTGGAAITEYTATSEPGGQFCSTAKTLTCVIDGLSNGTLYTVTVTATSNSGASPPSATAGPVMPRTVPYPPMETRATPTLGQATVTWAPPASDGGTPIQRYVVSASPGDRQCMAQAPHLTCVVSGLTNGVPYTFTVTAVNAVGSSAPSAPSPSVTPDFLYSPIGVPVLAPSGITVTLNSMTMTPKTGSVQLTISYTLTNSTVDRRLDEGSFKLFFTEGTGEPQYGFFGALFPGDSLTRTYSWEYLSGQTPLLVEYDAGFFAPTPSPQGLKWKAPSV